VHLGRRVGEEHHRIAPAIDAERRLAKLDPFAFAYLEQRLRGRGEFPDVLLGDRDGRPAGDRASGGVPVDQLAIGADDRDAVARFAREQAGECQRLALEHRRKRPPVR